MRIKIRRDKGPILSCSKSFGERCTLEGLPEGVVSPNAAKSASLVKNVASRPFCEGVFHQTIWNNACEASGHNKTGPGRVGFVEYCVRRPPGRHGRNRRQARG